VWNYPSAVGINVECFGCFRVSPNPGMLQLAAVPGPSSSTEPWQMFTQEVVLTFLVVLCYFVARGNAKAPAVGAAYLATTLTSSVSLY
jgi:hypothetical protein